MNKFKKFSETEVVEAPGENDTLVLISDGEVKRVSAAAFAASAGGGVEPIRLYNKTTSGLYAENYMLEDGSPVPENLYELYLAGNPILIADPNTEDFDHAWWYSVVSAGVSFGNMSGYVFIIITSEGTKALLVPA